MQAWLPRRTALLERLQQLEHVYERLLAGRGFGAGRHQQRGHDLLTQQIAGLERVDCPLRARHGSEEVPAREIQLGERVERLGARSAIVGQREGPFEVLERLRVAGGRLGVGQLGQHRHTLILGRGLLQGSSQQADGGGRLTALQRRLGARAQLGDRPGVAFAACQQELCTNVLDRGAVGTQELGRAPPSTAPRELRHVGQNRRADQWMHEFQGFAGQDSVADQRVRGRLGTVSSEPGQPGRTPQRGPVAQDRHCRHQRRSALGQPAQPYDHRAQYRLGNKSFDQLRLVGARRDPIAVQLLDQFLQEEWVAAGGFHAGLDELQLRIGAAMLSDERADRR
jgi:hypothetical protein